MHTPEREDFGWRLVEVDTLVATLQGALLQVTRREQSDFNLVLTGAGVRD